MANQSKNLGTIFVASAVMVVALAFLLWYALGRAPEDASVLNSYDFEQVEPEIARIPDGFGGLQVGEAAPAFELMGVDGETVALSDFAGQPVMVNFWATWCAPCRIEMPEMQAAFEKHADEGFVILALNQDESAELVAEFFYDEMALTFTPLLDENSVVAAEFGVYGYNPSSFFIDGDGMIAGRHIGPLTESQLDSYLAEILP